MKTEIKEDVVKTIIKHNKLYEKLDKLQEIAELIYDRFSFTNDRSYEMLIYKDSNGNEINADEFWSTLLDFIDNNQIFLNKESLRLFKNN